MEIYLLRHGIAIARGTPGYDDDGRRPLTRRGEKRIRAIARTLKSLGLQFDLILSSPLLRARRTAELVAGELEAGDRLRLTADLSPQGDPAGLFRELQTHRPAIRRVLLVGHEPYLSNLISTLLAGDTRIPLTLKKGGVCKLTAASPLYGRCAMLEWLLAPKHLR